MAMDHITFGVLGIPVDEFKIEQVIRRIDDAISHRKKILISTVNTNFLVNSRVNRAFRLSLLKSEVCTVDGIGMLMMCRLASAPGISRVSGADMLEHLLAREHTDIGRPLRVFFFGGNEAVADRARHVINKMPSSAICCVGSLNPGFGSMDEISRPEVLQIINDAHPDFLIAALGAERGQEWIMRNRASLNAPVCAHLGAAVNFVAGSVQRAPRQWQGLGLEWLWRIRQEPVLARRYWRDGLVLLRLLALDALPLALAQLRDRLVLRVRPRPLKISCETAGPRTVITVSGAAYGCGDLLDDIFVEAVELGRAVTLDCRSLDAVDAASVGMIMRLERDLEAKGLNLIVRSVPGGVGHRLAVAGAAA